MDLDLLMLGFNAELEKQASSVAELGAKALKAAVGGLESAGGSVKRFGQRQLHSVSGWTPKGYMNPEGIKEMQAGSHDAFERLTAARKAAGSPNYKPGMVDKVLGRTPEEIHSRVTQAAHKELAGAQKAYSASRKAESMGLTSLPGYAKALASNPGEALHAGFAEQWHGMGPAGKALMFGLPAAAVGNELAKPSQPNGPGRLERAGTQLGGLAMAAGPLPLTGQIVAGELASEAGKGIGHLLGKKPKHIPAPPTLEPAGGTTMPGETIVTDRALGVGTQGFS